MNKFSVDYEGLQGNLYQEKYFRLNDVKDKIEKVAFDVVRFIDSDNIDGLWQIRQSDEGEYIVAMYDDQVSDSPVTKSSYHWSAMRDKTGSNVHVFYKGTPVSRIVLADLGLSKEESISMCRYLPAKLAENKNLAASLLKELPENERQELFTKYPELNQ